MRVRLLLGMKLAKVALAAEIFHCKSADVGPKEARKCQGRGQFPKFVYRPVIPPRAHEVNAYGPTSSAQSFWSAILSNLRLLLTLVRNQKGSRQQHVAFEFVERQSVHVAQRLSELGWCESDCNAWLEVWFEKTSLCVCPAM